VNVSVPSTLPLVWHSPTKSAKVIQVSAPGCSLKAIDSHALWGEEFMAQFRPLHDRVLVRRIEAQEKTAGGIIIPDTAKEKPQEGEVIAVGAGARSDAGTVTPLDGEDFIIMKESDILGIIEGVAEARKAA
jgi:chaperonin GroES